MTRINDLIDENIIDTVDSLVKKKKVHGFSIDSLQKITSKYYKIDSFTNPEKIQPQVKKVLRPLLKNKYIVIRNIVIFDLVDSINAKLEFEKIIKTAQYIEKSEHQKYELPIYFYKGGNSYTLVNNLIVFHQLSCSLKKNTILKDIGYFNFIKSKGVKTVKYVKFDCSFKNLVVK